MTNILHRSQNEKILRLIVRMLKRDNIQNSGTELPEEGALLSPAFPSVLSDQIKQEFINAAKKLKQEYNEDDEGVSGLIELLFNEDYEEIMKEKSKKAENKRSQSFDESVKEEEDGLTEDRTGKRSGEFSFAKRGEEETNLKLTPTPIGIYFEST